MVESESSLLFQVRRQTKLLFYESDEEVYDDDDDDDDNDLEEDDKVKLINNNRTFNTERPSNPLIKDEAFKNIGSEDTDKESPDSIKLKGDELTIIEKINTKRDRDRDYIESPETKSIDGDSIESIYDFDSSLESPVSPLHENITNFYINEMRTKIRRK